MMTMTQMTSRTTSTIITSVVELNVNNHPNRPAVETDSLVPARLYHFEQNNMLHGGWRNDKLYFDPRSWQFDCVITCSHLENASEATPAMVSLPFRPLAEAVRPS